MARSGDSKDAKRRYESGYYDGRYDKINGKPYDEQDASSDDWIEGYWDGYNERFNKYEVVAATEAATKLASKEINLREFKAAVRAL